MSEEGCQVTKCQVANHSAVKSDTYRSSRRGADQGAGGHKGAGAFQEYLKEQGQFRTMAERVCQFYLRGRCQRVKCEFRHPADQAPGGPAGGGRSPAGGGRSPGGGGRSPAGGGRGGSDTHCKFFLSSGCKFGATCHYRHVGRERRRSRSRSRVCNRIASN